MARKNALAAIAIFFKRQPVVCALSSAAVMFVALAHQLWLRPYHEGAHRIVEAPVQGTVTCDMADDADIDVGMSERTYSVTLEDGVTHTFEVSERQAEVERLRACYVHWSAHGSPEAQEQAREHLSKEGEITRMQEAAVAHFEFEYYYDCS